MRCEFARPFISYPKPTTRSWLLKPFATCVLVTGAIVAFLETDGDELAADVAAGRERSSASCEAIEFGAAGALSSAIADMIFKRGETYTLSGDPLLDRVLKCARTAPLNYKPPHPKEIGWRYLDAASARCDYKNTQKKLDDAGRRHREARATD
jgi:hypothetical protein